MASLLYGSQTITIYRKSRCIRSIDIITILIISSCGSGFNPIELRAISARAWSELKNYPPHFRSHFSRMANMTNDYFENNPGASSFQLSNTYRTTPLRITTSDASRLQRALVDLPTPRSLEEAESMLYNRNMPIPTESTPIVHESDNTPDNLFASMLTEGSASPFY
ncbi:5581_t:CDS:1 [Diversispora eburnea]|uniref:5581_t:CDS:1 n=1 Tax=Diversispora eburnea TaxID=1213867 RepID=A0A9N8YT03_9GLOM|nr:5581_t:CDS:1 [Diversispora eburnea]